MQLIATSFGRLSSLQLARFPDGLPRWEAMTRGWWAGEGRTSSSAFECGDVAAVWRSTPAGGFCIVLTASQQEFHPNVNHAKRVLCRCQYKHYILLLLLLTLILTNMMFTPTTSHVGHIFRPFHPYFIPHDSHGINTARMAEVTIHFCHR